ncbi:DUF4357 domain-containing protein [Acetobacter oeni]|uniref:DUF4357 domain-containing protein n=1 Tax=Acetobacter oeni TaxID=304077 RepID=A0A511XMP8_9PROT|nr:DUF4357 domain-containing protein [Acetobacter oeni]GEN64196.1 hypothetical protein AOE01nite_24200 [Acetobacter oeni]
MPNYPRTIQIYLPSGDPQGIRVAAITTRILQLIEIPRANLTTLGYPIFEPLIKDRRGAECVNPGTQHLSATPDPTSALFFCCADGVDAHARYTEERLVVLAGSYGRSEASASSPENSPGYYAKRQALTEQGAIRIEDGRAIFPQDTLFKNPSPAAVFLMGRSSNGWTEWKDAQNRTLADVPGRNHNSSENPT